MGRRRISLEDSGCSDHPVFSDTSDASSSEDEIFDADEYQSDGSTEAMDLDDVGDDDPDLDV